MKIIFWSEFPEKVDWKKFNSLLKFNVDVYIACKSRKEFSLWEDKIKSKKIKLGVWPVLSKKDGYWFSGFTNKKDVDKLKEFKVLDIKIDLEPPLPKYKYSNFNMLRYLSWILFNKPKNSKYLEKEILELSKKNKIILNLFPFPKWFLKWKGLYFKIPNATENYMMYSTYAGSLFRPFIIFLNKRFLRKNKVKMCSIGLIGRGILESEGIYKNIEEFKEDLEMVKGRDIAIYSVESLMNKKRPEEWLKIIEDYI